MNTDAQHLVREIFSESQFAAFGVKFCRQFKGKFSQPDREFESYLLRQLVHCFSVEIQGAEIIWEIPRLSPAEIGASGKRERGLENAGAFGWRILRSAIRRSGYG